RQLRDEIFGDLDPQGFGVGWWRGHLDPGRAIAISDYMLQLSTSVRETSSTQAFTDSKFSTRWNGTRGEWRAQSPNIAQSSTLRGRRRPKNSLATLSPFTLRDSFDRSVRHWIASPDSLLECRHYRSLLSKRTSH